jgi:hypothetical protein
MNSKVKIVLNRFIYVGIVIGAFILGLKPRVDPNANVAMTAQQLGRAVGGAYVAGRVMLRMPVKPSASNPSTDRLSDAGRPVAAAAF